MPEPAIQEIATVAALTAMGTAAPQLRARIEGALNVGSTEQEVVEVIMQMALYTGSPAAMNEIQTAREVFLEQTQGVASPIAAIRRLVIRFHAVAIRSNRL